MKLSHIGIAVESLDEASKIFSDLLSVKPGPVKEVSDQKVKTVFFPLNGRTKIELLVPVDRTGPIRKFLDKRGPGIHHLAFAVEDINARLNDLKEKGYRLVDDTPRIGAEGKKIAFLHPSSTSGVLIELEEE